MRGERGNKAHSAYNWSVDKVSALRGSIDTRESITSSSVGRVHNWDAEDCWFESHKIQLGDFFTAVQTDMPDIEWQNYVVCITYLLLIQPLGEVNNGWICALVPRMRTLNGGPVGRRVTPWLVLWTLFEKRNVKTRCSFTPLIPKFRNWHLPAWCGWPLVGCCRVPIMGGL